MECTEVLITEFDEENEDKNFPDLAHTNRKFYIFPDAINTCLASMKRYDLILSDTEQTLAMDFVKVLETFEKATDVMQGDKYPTLNLAVFCYEDIKAR